MDFLQFIKKLSSFAKYAVQVGAKSILSKNKKINHYLQNQTS